MRQREEEILNNIIDVLKKYLNPNQIILFGSRARKIFSRNSDFDLAVAREKVDVKLERQVKEKIEEVAGLYKIDVVFLDSINQDLKELILKTGEIIYERNS